MQAHHCGRNEREIRRVDFCAICIALLSHEVKGKSLIPMLKIDYPLKYIVLVFAVYPLCSYNYQVTTYRRLPRHEYRGREGERLPGEEGWGDC